MDGMPRPERPWRDLALLLLIAAGPSMTFAQEPAGVEGASIHFGFADHFEPYDIAPKAPELPASAVDLTQIEIPLEPEAIGRSLGTGVASYYGRRFHGRRTANGERFDMHQLTAAHRTLPFGSLVKVTNPRNGRSVVVRINDRGPFSQNRTIDLSRAAAEQIGLIRRGHGKVELALLSP